MLKKAMLLVQLVALSLTACGGGGSATPTCSPKGTALTVSAQNYAFSTDCLAVPANQAFTIALNNQDAGIAHNVTILDGSKELFKGDLITGPSSTTYQVQKLPPGNYTFRCDVHPDQMHGSFDVKAAHS